MSEQDKLLSAEDVDLVRSLAELPGPEDAQLSTMADDLADRLEETLKLFTAEDVRWLNEDCDGRFTPETLGLGDRLSRLVQ